MNYLVVEKFGFKIIGPIEDGRINEAACLFRGRGYRVWYTLAPPSNEVLQTYKNDNFGLCSDGCTVQGWSSCRHGHRAWIAIYRNLIK